MQDWLLDTGSLTERLQSLCSSFEVEVLGQKSLPLEEAERAAIPGFESQRWQIREVILRGDGKPWVFARSVLPHSLCEQKWADLGNQPLGQRIFNDTSFIRSNFDIGKLSRHPLTHKIFEHKDLQNTSTGTKKADSFWARRSIFSYEGDAPSDGQSNYENNTLSRTILVAEAFLPDCPCYKKQTQKSSELEV